MELDFIHPWLVFPAVTAALVAVVIAVWRKRAGVGLFLLAAAAFFAAGARPQLVQAQPEIRHALVVDVSASMQSRELGEFVDAIRELELPARHSLTEFELSDALRERGGIRGDGTDYARLAEIANDENITGEVIFITDGRGDFDALYSAIPPSRLILLHPPTSLNPDARVVDLRAPPVLPAGTGLQMQATVGSDVAADVPWKLLQDGAEVASGKLSLRANTLRTITQTLTSTEPGLSEITLQLALPNDRELRNDAASVRTFVGGMRRIEYCVPAEFSEPSDAMLQLLRADARNDVRVRHDLPTDQSELQGVGAVFINNLPLRATRDELRVLADWVEAGGSLVMLGTDGAFGPGGYRNTPIESVMPVRFRPDDAPPQRTLLLLDVSQSMDDRLPGGETKLQRMKGAARRFQDALGERDQAAVVGFREGLVGQIAFKSALDATLADSIAGLNAGGSTHIRSALAAAVNSVPEDTRILLITDGEEVEGAGDEMYHAIADNLIATRTRLDVVLTTAGDKPWLAALQDRGGDSVHVWSVGDEGFDGLLETLDRAMAGADKDWIINAPLDATGAGAPVPRIVRTALRDDRSVQCPVFTTEPATYPVLAHRSIVGRTVALCTDSWGGNATVSLWLDAAFRDALDDQIAFALQNANAVNLVLNSLDTGAELVWTGSADAPTGDLVTDNATARMDVPGRWLLDDYPEGTELRVFDGDRLLQRIPLPALVPHELRHTGNDPAFFARSEAAGIRVFSGLAAWSPGRFGEAADTATDFTWLTALIAMLLLTAGYAVSRN